MAKYKLISCNVFQRELCAAIAESPNVVDPEFLELGLHENSERLRARLQERIDEATAASERGGRSLRQVRRDPPRLRALRQRPSGDGGQGPAPRPRPRPRLLHHTLGVARRLPREFRRQLERAPGARPGTSSGAPPTSDLRKRGRATGLGLEYEELVAQYGEENARYVWDTMHPAMEEKEIRFIETAETAALGYAESMRAKAAEEGKEFFLLRGSSRLLRALVAGAWDDSEFLVVPPGKRVEALYDHERILAAR